MNTYLALFLIATFASLVITPVIRRVCERFGLLDVPSDGRRVHVKAIPRLGGVAIYLSLAIALSTLPLVSNLLTESLAQFKDEVLVAAIPATLVLLLGIYDDLRGTNAAVKFVGLGLIGTLFFAMGGRIEALAIPFAGTVHFPMAVSFIITVFWLVAISNAFNLIDGMDGLATGAALFASVVILIVSLAQANPLMIVFSLVLCGALTGFLRYNFNPASIFLGDSGALFIGFLLAALSVLSAQKATTSVAVITPLLAFGLPVVDTGVTMARRLISGQPMFQGDGEHIHHMLLARGWSQRRVVLILYGVCAAFGLTAALSTTTSSPQTGFVLFVIAVAVTIAVGHLRYHEVDELRAGMKRTVGDRRLRVANNIRIRRAGRALSKATNLGELFNALAVMLEFGEFAYSNIQLGELGRADVSERAVRATDHRTIQKLEMRNGRIWWSWKREGVHEEQVIGSPNVWCLRLPLAADGKNLGWINLYRPFNDPPLLVDTNYLSGLLHTHLSEAAVRILESYAKPAGAKEVPIRAAAGKVTG
ncbi:MAG TPA: MraY family glycosyltransferase [Pyrinomonadaceae bacterium]|nr:MraY family glycosyltransferase [Pyrinomonadaceae bacterium]